MHLHVDSQEFTRRMRPRHRTFNPRIINTPGKLTALSTEAAEIEFGEDFDRPFKLVFPHRKDHKEQIDKARVLLSLGNDVGKLTVRQLHVALLQGIKQVEIAHHFNESEYFFRSSHSTANTCLRLLGIESYKKLKAMTEQNAAMELKEYYDLPLLEARRLRPLNKAKKPRLPAPTVEPAPDSTVVRPVSYKVTIEYLLLLLGINLKPLDENFMEAESVLLTSDVLSYIHNEINHLVMDTGIMQISPNGDGNYRITVNTERYYVCCAQHGLFAPAPKDSAVAEVKQPDQAPTVNL
jgi:hypothetical protein